MPGSVWALNLNASRGAIGAQLYNYNFTPPAGLGDAAAQAQVFSPHDTTYSGVNPQAGIFWYVNSMYRQWYVFSLADGHPMWTSDEGQQFEFYGMGSVVVYNNEFIDCGGYAGVVRAYNAQTGAFLWNWTAPSVGLGETPYQYTPTSYGLLSGDGQLYLYSSEHSVNNPIRRDGAIWDVNATTGTELWQETCWPSGAPILADGDLLVLDDHDNQIYNYGKGPSATTVTAPTVGVTQGQSFPIQGTVMDTSVGTTETAIVQRFPTGVPAVSDASENAWMEYVYHQRPMQSNTTGVQVEITLIDPNGNVVVEPAVTSDATGHYSLDYNANSVPGMYTVTANFVGTNSNYPSSAETSFVVNPAPAATVAPTATPTSVADTYFVPAIAGLFVLIIVVAIVLALLMLRKRP